MPFEAQPGSATLAVRSPQGTSAEYTLTIAAASPGIFQFDGNRAVATDAAGVLLTATHPAAPGSVIILYLTGIGSLTNTPQDGAGAPLYPLAKATLPATATIGGADAPASFWD